jgi:hypothetical protein
MEEELRMSKLGFQHGGIPEHRYAHIPIAGFTLRSDAAPPADGLRKSVKVRDAGSAGD